MKAGEKLVADIEALRQQPNSDLVTLGRVAVVLRKHAGRRLTVPAPIRRSHLVAQAKALSAAIDAGDRAEGVRIIKAAMGVHRSTVYRYLRGT